MVSDREAVIVCDIDETIASGGIPHRYLAPILRALSSVCPVVFLTGRSNSGETRAELARLGFAGSRVLLRPRSRHREAPHVWKAQRLRALTTECDVLLLIDDDPHMRHAAQSLGIATLRP